jgi:hypothetical protein
MKKMPHNNKGKKTAVLLVSTSYPASARDWKGVFIRRICDALASSPEIELRCWMPPGEMADNIIPVMRPAEARWLDRLMASGGIAHLLRTHRLRAMLSATRLLFYLWRLFRRERNSVDVLHVNWLQNAIGSMLVSKPMLVSVLGTDIKLLRLPGVVWLLRLTFANKPVALAPNAKWMVPVLEQHFGDCAHIKHVNFGVDQELFEIQRQVNAAKRRWLVVLRITSKKMGELFNWGRDIFQTDSDELILLGPMQEEIEIPEWVNYQGHTTPDELRHKWFPQAAGLITLSEHDEGMPQVLLEGMAASIPVVASDISAHRDLVADGVTGFIVQDRQQFNLAISELREIERNRLTGERARDKIAREYGTWRDCASRYQSLYDICMGGAQ